MQNAISPLEESAEADTIERIAGDQDSRMITKNDAERVYHQRRASESLTRLDVLDRQDVELRQRRAERLMPEAIPKPTKKNRMVRYAGPILLAVSVSLVLFLILPRGEAGEPAPAAVAAVMEAEAPAPPATPSAPPAPELAPDVPIERQMSAQARISSLTRHFRRVNPDLIPCVGELVGHDRYLEAVAIARQETNYCRTGVGRFNNCGGIKSGRADREWRHYASACDGLEDIAYLIESGRYAGQTIDEMNGTYCVDSSRPGRQCEHWSENIMRTVNELRADLAE